MATPLAEFLANRDVPCPGCEYNLRGLTGETCPECGKQVTIAWLRQHMGPRVSPTGLYFTAIALVGMIGMWLVAAMVGVVVVYRVVPPSAFAIVFSVAWIMLLASLALFAWPAIRRGRYPRDRLRPRHLLVAILFWSLIASGLIVPFLAIVFGDWSVGIE